MLPPMPLCFLDPAMAKDPAFLFYYQDFLVGTDHLSNEAVGAYIRCMCHQAHKGFIRIDHLKKICRKNSVYESIVEKFVSDGNGNLYNERLSEAVQKRKEYAESRRRNRAQNKDPSDEFL
jgi:uncharacterized protein YdaU (DUF1376 family)